MTPLRIVDYCKRLLPVNFRKKKCAKKTDVVEIKEIRRIPAGPLDGIVNPALEDDDKISRVVGRGRVVGANPGRGAVIDYGCQTRTYEKDMRRVVVQSRKAEIAKRENSVNLFDRLAGIYHATAFRSFAPIPNFLPEEIERLIDAGSIDLLVENLKRYYGVGQRINEERLLNLSRLRDEEGLMREVRLLLRGYMTKRIIGFGGKDDKPMQLGGIDGRLCNIAPYKIAFLDDCAESSEYIYRVYEPMPLKKRKLIFMAGKGGVGKSTMAAELAVFLSFLGCRAWILNNDTQPSIERSLGCGFDANGRIMLNGKEVSYVDDYLKMMSGKGVSHELREQLVKDKSVRINSCLRLLPKRLNGKGDEGNIFYTNRDKLKMLVGATGFEKDGRIVDADVVIVDAQAGSNVEDWRLFYELSQSNAFEFELMLPLGGEVSESVACKWLAGFMEYIGSRKTGRRPGIASLEEGNGVCSTMDEKINKEELTRKAEPIRVYTAGVGIGPEQYRAAVHNLMWAFNSRNKNGFNFKDIAVGVLGCVGYGQIREESLFEKIAREEHSTLTKAYFDTVSGRKINKFAAENMAIASQMLGICCEYARAGGYLKRVASRKIDKNASV